LDAEYSFHLVLRTSAGTYSSEKLAVRTHKMTDLSGITVCPGVMPGETREEIEATLQRIGAKPLQDFVRIDTTHFVCTEGRGQNWERAQEMNIPVVRPEWLQSCEREGRIVGVRQFYLSADLSKMRQGLPQQRSQQQQHRPTPSVTDSAVTTPVAERRDSRQGSPVTERRETRHESPVGPEQEPKKEDDKEPSSPEGNRGGDSSSVEVLDNPEPGNASAALDPETPVVPAFEEKKPEEGFEEVRL
jgi:hypothetical protein